MKHTEELDHNSEKFRNQVETLASDIIFLLHGEPVKGLEGEVKRKLLNQEIRIRLHKGTIANRDKELERLYTLRGKQSEEIQKLKREFKKLEKQLCAYKTMPLSAKKLVKSYGTRLEFIF